MARDETRSEEAVMAPLILGLGVLLVLVAALADVVRIGGEPGFGSRQGAGVVVGIVLIIAGVWWMRRG